MYFQASDKSREKGFLSPSWRKINWVFKSNRWEERKALTSNWVRMIKRLHFSSKLNFQSWNYSKAHFWESRGNLKTKKWAFIKIEDRAWISIK